MTARGGRPSKPAVPGSRAVLGLRVTAETKNLLDEAAKRSGRTQAQEAERLIELGRLFEEFGRFTLPPEMQPLAVELITAYSAGPNSLILYLMSSAANEEERWFRWHSYRVAIDSYRANHPIHPPSEPAAPGNGDSDRNEGHD
jgi:TraY domain